METNRIRQFLVVSQTRNLRQAADILHMSHSGLSKSLRALELELGDVKLFIREGRGIVLSDHGKELVQRAPQLLEAVETFKGRKPGANSEPILRLATFEVFSTYFLGAFCKHYSQSLRVRTRECIPGAIEEAVLKKIADVGITYEPIPTQGVDFLAIAKIRMGVFICGESLAAMTLAELPFVTPVAPLHSTPTGVKGLDGWPSNKVPRTVRYEVEMMESGLELCRQGLAAIFIPEFIASLHNQKYNSRFQLHEIQADSIQVFRKVYLVKRISSVEDRKFKTLARAIRELCSFKREKA